MGMRMVLFERGLKIGIRGNQRQAELFCHPLRNLITLAPCLFNAVFSVTAVKGADIVDAQMRQIQGFVRGRQLPRNDMKRVNAAGKPGADSAGVGQRRPGGGRVDFNGAEGRRIFYQ